MDGKQRIWLTVVSGVGLLAGLLAFALYALLGGYTGGRTFGAVYMTMSAPYYEILSDELRAAVEERGGRLLSRDPEGDPDLQVQEIYDLIGQKVDGLFLDVLNTPAVDAAVNAARAAGIPVVALDTPRADSRMVDCTVTSDNHMGRPVRPRSAQPPDIRPRARPVPERFGQHGTAGFRLCPHARDVGELCRRADDPLRRFHERGARGDPRGD